MKIGFLNISSNFEKAHIIISSLDVKKDIRKIFKKFNILGNVRPFNDIYI